MSHVVLALTPSPLHTLDLWLPHVAGHAFIRRSCSLFLFSACATHGEFVFPAPLRRQVLFLKTVEAAQGAKFVRCVLVFNSLPINFFVA